MNSSTLSFDLHSRHDLELFAKTIAQLQFAGVSFTVSRTNEGCYAYISFN